MLLFKKKDLLVVLTKDGDTVEFSKPIADILKYQHRYNYKFKLYETGKVTVADDYIIEGETLTVFFGSAYVTYSSSGATYNDGGGSGGEGGDSTCEDCVKIINGESVDTMEHPTDHFFAYTESLGWVDITGYPIAGVFNTEDDIPNAYVTNELNIGVAFPMYIHPLSDYVTGETHIPETGNKGYYIEYADAYSLSIHSEYNTLVIKNGVVNYFEGLS